MEKTIVLWIQIIPETYETVLSVNGVRLIKGSPEYRDTFKKLVSVDLDNYTKLSSTLSKFSNSSHWSNVPFINKDHVETFLAGHFEQTDSSNRLICYRALVTNTENEEQVCELLKKEAQIYGCSISSENELLIKKSSFRFKPVFALSVFVIIIFIIIWIVKNLKMS